MQTSTLRNTEQPFKKNDSVDYYCVGIGVISGIVERVYDVPYVTIIAYDTNERFYAPLDRVSHA